MNQKMRSVYLLSLLILSLSLTGCANLHTIGRHTDIPSYQDKGVGKAIHLDAQQRLVVFNGLQKYCAEPSPDALAAYASSLGLSATGPSEREISIAQALQSSTGSIGLRTQSITLMRDALYRICEAYSNGAINEIQAVALLGRSLDLMAVILAIEQLTGAVVPRQILITGKAESEEQDKEDKPKANATSSGRFSSSIHHVELRADAAKEIARAVKDMVKAVLNKNYIRNSCMVLLTMRANDPKNSSYERALKLCIDILSRDAYEGIIQLESHYRPDTWTEELEKELEKNPTMRGCLKKWLEGKGHKFSITILLYGAEYTELRKQAIEHEQCKST